MIYHNYSPYYYVKPVNLNKNYSNFSNNDSRFLRTYNKISTFSPQNINKNNKNYSENIKNGYYKSNFALPQLIKEDKEKSLKSKKIPPKSNDDIIFEIFGIKLYFDDILLICLIFFLYNEGVQDQYLFIALVLLLLS